MLQIKEELSCDFIISLHKKTYVDTGVLDSTFLDYVREALDEFVHSEEPEKGQSFTAYYDNMKCGTITMVKVDDTTAQLRWFAVDREFQGRNIGTALLETALKYSEDKGFTKVMLWTKQGLPVSRYLYTKYDFIITEDVRHTVWGLDTTEEKWEKEFNKNER